MGSVSSAASAPTAAFVTPKGSRRDRPPGAPAWRGGGPVRRGLGDRPRLHLPCHHWPPRVTRRPGGGLGRPARVAQLRAHHLARRRPRRALKRWARHPPNVEPFCRGPRSLAPLGGAARRSATACWVLSEDDLPRLETLIEREIKQFAQKFLTKCLARIGRSCMKGIFRLQV